MARGEKVETVPIKGVGAEEIYGGKYLKRFSEKNMAFKKVSEDLGEPWFEVWLRNMLGQYKKAQIGIRFM